MRRKLRSSIAPEDIYGVWPVSCHVSRHVHVAAQIDCLSIPPQQIFFRFSTEMPLLAGSMSLPLTEARFHEPFVLNDYHRSILDGS